MTKEKDRPAPGRFICLEGIDGSGKTTQSECGHVPPSS